MESHRLNIVVVGAGLAGLAAAWRLQQRGHEVSVLERSKRAGGRVGGEWVDDLWVDRSLQIVHTGDRRLLAWSKEVGVADRLLPLRPLQLAQVHRGASSPIEPQSLLGVAAIPGVRPWQAARLVRWSRLMSRYAPLLDPTAPERAASLDYRSAADFTRLYFGDSCFERWVSPELAESFGGDGSEQSRVATLLGWVARGTGRARSALHGLPRHGLSELVEAVAKRLSIRNQVEATRVDEAPAGGFTVECRGLTGGRGTLEADAVVLANAPAEAGRVVEPLLSPAERDYLARVEHAPTLHLAVLLDRAPAGLPQLVRVPHCERLPIDSLLLEPGLAGGRVPMGRGLVTLRATERYALASADVPDEVVVKELSSCLERLFPSIVGSVRSTRLRRAEREMPRFEVGAYRAIERFRRVQADRRELARRLYFAGDYLIGPRAEDAVVAGLRAAEDVLADAERTDR